MLLIAFAGAVLFTVLNFDRVVAVIVNVLGMCTPFFVGIVLAFILNMIMVPTRNFLEKKILKKETKWSKGVSIIISYLVLIAAVVALLAFVVFVPFMHGLFMIAELTMSQVLWIVGLAAIPTVLIQLFKALRRAV